MDFPQPELWRWTIDTTRGVVHAEQIDGRSAEFPRVADSVTGLKHRYGYLAGASPETDPMDASGAILKYDRNTGTRTDIEFGRGRIGGEPVFVPSENAKSEDDGYLMTYVYDAKTDSSSFVIMDAATMDNSPIASIELPRIPSGFHGNWIDAKIAN